MEEERILIQRETLYGVLKKKKKIKTHKDRKPSNGCEAGGGGGTTAGCGRFGGQAGLNRGCACHKQHKGRRILLYVNCAFINLPFSIIKGYIFSLLGQEDRRMVTRLGPTRATERLSSKIIKK